MIRAKGTLALTAAVVALSLLVTACGSSTGRTASSSEPKLGNAVSSPVDEKPKDRSGRPGSSRPSVDVPSGNVTLAFAGDMHFEYFLVALLDRPRGALGPITSTLQAADVAMVNLETSITDRGVRLHMDYAFRTSPAALEVLDAAGVDVATMANNHGVDYGPVGLRDTLQAVDRGPIPVIGIGRDRQRAFRPYRVSIGGTHLAFLAASNEPDQLARSAAGPDKAGIAAARSARPRVLLSAVREADRRDDVVVVYLHWGKELQSCPAERQRRLARALAGSGADVIVGSHAHVLLGSGWLGHTYVDYGLGNFLWYHDREPTTGVLQVHIRDGEVVGDAWAPAVIRTDGRPYPLHGESRSAAIADWRGLRDCTGLASRPTTSP